MKLVILLAIVFCLIFADIQGHMELMARFVPAQLTSVKKFLVNIAKWPTIVERALHDPP